MTKWLFLIILLTFWIFAGTLIFDTDAANINSVSGQTKNITRIVSIAPNITETLFTLGLGDRIVGVTLYSEHPPEAKTKPMIGSFWQPDIEAIIAAKPDMIMTVGFPQQRNLADRLNRIGYDTMTFDIESIEEFFNATKQIGIATGKQTQANDMIETMKGKLQSLSGKLAGLEKPRVLWVVQMEPLRVAGTTTFVNEMIEMAGGVNAMERTVHQYPPIGSEQVIACKPDVIIQPAMIVENMDRERDNAISFWQRFENVPAVKNERIHIIEGDIVSQLGPRLYDGVELIAKCLRPELFEQGNIK